MPYLDGWADRFRFRAELYLRRTAETRRGSLRSISAFMAPKADSLHHGPIPVKDLMPGGITFWSAETSTMTDLATIWPLAGEAVIVGP